MARYAHGDHIDTSEETNAHQIKNDSTNLGKNQEYTRHITWSSYKKSGALDIIRQGNHIA